jgi:hypothetical protein
MQTNSAHWPEPSAHRIYWERFNCALVYEYDPADDGPEWDTLKSIRAGHSREDILEEIAEYGYTTFLADAMAKNLKRHGGRCRGASMQYLERLRLRGVAL